MPATADATGLGFPHHWMPGSEPDAPTLLLLHGTGATEDDLLGLGRYLSPSSSLLSPRGRVREDGMNRWFRRLAEGVFDTDDVVRRAGELADFVDAAADVHGFDRTNVVAAGFSNGANIAAALLLLHPQVLRAAVLFSSMLPLRPSTRPELSHAAVYLGQGRVDPMAPADSAAQLAELLTDAGAAVQLDWHDAGHRLSAAEVEPARAWLDRVRAATGSDRRALP